MGNPTQITAAEAKKLEANPKVASLVKDIKAKYDAENAVEVVSNSPVELNGDRENVRVRETNLGNVSQILSTSMVKQDLVIQRISL